jgi:drug/metabolite transporter (DMT)-like permease
MVYIIRIHERKRFHNILLFDGFLLWRRNLFDWYNVSLLASQSITDLLLYNILMNTQILGLFLLAFVSATGMGVSQKFLSWYSPYLVNGIASGIVAVLALSIRYFQKNSDLTWWSWHRAMMVLGLSFLWLNVAYSMLYGQDIPVAYVPIIVIWVTTVILWFAGFFLFHETITWRFVVGAVMILAGMWVMVMR